MHKKLYCADALATFWSLDGKCASPEVSRGDLDRVSEVEKGTLLKFLPPLLGPPLQLKGYCVCSSGSGD